MQFDVGTEEYLQLLRDAERLQTYETLTGTELGEIVGRSSLMYVNVKRRALQQVYCTDKTLVVFNLPLSPTQWAEFVATGPLDQ